MYKIKVLEVLVSGEKTRFCSVSSKPFFNYDLEKGEISSDVVYYTGNFTSYFFGLFQWPDKELLLKLPTKTSDWELKYKLPNDQENRKIRNMGVSGAIGFAVAGPVGAAAGAYLANKDDVPITLKNKNGILIKGPVSGKLIQEILNKKFYEDSQ
jgi:hypothetical protein